MEWELKLGEDVYVKETLMVKKQMLDVRAEGWTQDCLSREELDFVWLRDIRNWYGLKEAILAGSGGED